jgi:hypothetical protein
MIADWEIDDYSGVLSGVFITDPELSRLVDFLRVRSSEGAGPAWDLYSKIHEAAMAARYQEPPESGCLGSISERSLA